MKVIIVEKPSQIQFFEHLIGEVISRYMFHTAGTTGHIISLMGYRPNVKDPFHGKYKTIKKLLTEADEIIVATEFSINGDMLYHLTRDLLEISRTFTRMTVTSLDEASITKAWNQRVQEGTYVIPL